MGGDYPEKTKGSGPVTASQRRHVVAESLACLSAGQFPGLQDPRSSVTPCKSASLRLTALVMSLCVLLLLLLSSLLTETQTCKEKGECP